MNIPLLILILFLPALFLAAFLLRRRKRISNLFLVAAAVLFTLLAAEFIYRVFLKSPEPVTEMECGDNCYQHDSILGFKPAVPGKWKVVTAQGSDTIVSTQYTIVADSIYDHRIGYNAGTTAEFVFLGCSFTFGSNIADSATLPYQFGKLSNKSAINLGCPAYGLHQIFQVLKSKYAQQNNSNRVFVYSLLSDHFFRAAGVYDWNLDGPYFNDSLKYAGPVNRNVVLRHMRAPYYFSFFGALHLVKDKLADITLRNRMKAFSKKNYDHLFLLLREMDRIITATGGKLIILNWDRSNWGYQGYEFPFQQQLDKDVSNFTTFNVSSILNYNDASNFIRLDGHPTYLANQRIASYLANKFH